MTLFELSDLYRVDRRTLYVMARLKMWGARKINGTWHFDSPPLSEPTMTVGVVANAIGLSREIVRRWCRESTYAKANGLPQKVRVTQVGRQWRIHFEDGARLIMAQLGGYRKKK
jgi:hypothetical protein